MAVSYGITPGERRPGEFHRDEFPESLRPDMTMGVGEKKPKKGKRRRKEAEADISHDLHDYESEKEKKAEQARSKKQKKLEKKEKKQQKQQMEPAGPAKHANSGLTLLKIVACLVFVAAVGVQGMDRIATANALTGSATSFIKDHTKSDSDVTDLEFEGDKDDEDTSDTDTDDEDTTEDADSYNPKKFKYIDAAKLDEKSATDLAVWYLSQFPEGETMNEEAYKEFNKWYDNKKSEDSAFSANFDTAVEYVKSHPELMNPNEKEPDTVEPETPEKPTTTPGSGTTTGPNTGTNTGATTPSSPNTGANNGGTDNGTSTEKPTSKYPNIDETALNSFSAAQVANWVFLNFPPDAASWDYQALSDYYNWVASKDATFRSSVNSYLEALGWNGNTN